MSVDKAEQSGKLFLDMTCKKIITKAAPTFASKS